MYQGEPGKALFGGKSKAWHVTKSVDLFPFEFLGMPVFNADASDIRPLDPHDVPIAGLTYKVARKKVGSAEGYKVKPGGRYAKLPVIDPEELPTFMVRCRLVDENAPPVVVGFTQSTKRVVVRDEALPEWIRTNDWNDVGVDASTGDAGL
jgi:hypothetical protein